MTNTSDTPPGADDETIVERPDTVEVQRVVTTTSRAPCQTRSSRRTPAGPSIRSFRPS